MTTLSRSREIQQARVNSYITHARRFPYKTDRDAARYGRLLPKFEGKDVTEHIGDKLNENPEPLNVLDIGCGDGLFLASIMINSRIRSFGLSAYDYRTFAPELLQGYMGRIDYRVGDGHRLARIFPDTRFDIVTSLHAVEYMTDSLAVLKQAYRITKTGGIIFIYPLMINLTEEQDSALIEYWKKQEITADLKRWAPADTRGNPATYSLAIKRASNLHLPLPFRYLLSRNSYLPSIQYCFEEALFEKDKI